MLLVCVWAFRVLNPFAVIPVRFWERRNVTMCLTCHNDLEVFVPFEWIKITWDGLKWPDFQLSFLPTPVLKPALQIDVRVCSYVHLEERAIMCADRFPVLSFFTIGFTVIFSTIVKVKVTQSCLTLCNPMGYTAHGILQARILEWVGFPFPRGSSQPRDRTIFQSSVVHHAW